MSNIEAEERIFSEAIEIEDPKEQEKFVISQTTENLGLRTRIFRLIETDKSNNILLDDDTFASDLLKDSLPPVEDVGDCIGGYKLVRPIGEGGMGTVFLASQTSPVKRNVAIKILKHSGNSGSIAQRFEIERQTLALMNHPNITRIFDGGITESGRPYFVMEYIEGKDILDYCQEENCTLRQRIELIKEIAFALHHAHLRGIIHRDIKPENILIEKIEGRAIPKIIDFGIARIIDQNQQENQFTYHGQLIGTLEYMSPEQVGGNPSSIDARTDVYSLGSVWYKLLTTVSPFSHLIQTNQGNLFKIIQSIEKNTVVKPSKKTESRQEENSKVPFDSSHLKGEIDWITLKALEKDPELRYESAKAFGDDLDNFLNGKIVSAAQPTLTYQLYKSFQRHTAAFLFSAAIATLLLVMAVGGTVLALQANSARNLAERRLKKVQKAEETEKGLRNLAEKRLKEVQEAKESEKQLRTFAEQERDRAIAAEAEARELIHQRQIQLVDSESRSAMFRIDEFSRWYQNVNAEINKTLRYEKFVRLVPGMYLETLPFKKEYAYLLEDRIRSTLKNSSPFFGRDEENTELPHHIQIKKIDVGKLDYTANYLTKLFEIRRAKLLDLMPPKDLSIAKESEELAAIYLSQDRVKEAIPLLVEAQKIRSHWENDGHADNSKLHQIQSIGLLGLCRLLNNEEKSGNRLIQQALTTPAEDNEEISKFQKMLEKFTRQHQLEKKSPETKG